jgi:hypothetical protein
MGYVILAKRRRLGDVLPGSVAADQSTPYLAPNPPGSESVLKFLNPFATGNLWTGSANTYPDTSRTWWDDFVNDFTGQVSDHEAAQLAAKTAAAILQAGGTPEQAKAAAVEVAQDAKSAAPGPAIGGRPLYDARPNAKDTGLPWGWIALGGAAILGVVILRSR